MHVFTSRGETHGSPPSPLFCRSKFFHLPPATASPLPSSEGLWSLWSNPDKSCMTIHVLCLPHQVRSDLKLLSRSREKISRQESLSALRLNVQNLDNPALPSIADFVARLKHHFHLKHPAGIDLTSGGVVQFHFLYGSKSCRNGCPSHFNLGDAARGV